MEKRVYSRSERVKRRPVPVDKLCTIGADRAAMARSGFLHQETALILNAPGYPIMIHPRFFRKESHLIDIISGIKSSGFPLLTAAAELSLQINKDLRSGWRRSRKAKRNGFILLQEITSDK